MPDKKQKIAVGLSGGVDSSVAAALLRDMGHDVIGITMEIFDNAFSVQESRRHACYGPGEKEDVEAAASVCKTLGIPFHCISLKHEYKEHVLEYFTREYLAGRTPNPCIVCNQKLKFGFLLDKARNMGLDFEMFATGHYARIERCGQRYRLKKSEDPAKDQTYFLYALTQKQLSHIRFPLGAYSKQEVRRMAGSLGLKSAARPESQDFVAGGDYSPLFDSDKINGGHIVDEAGRILGRHHGIVHYTVGQRKGLGIAAENPLYVLRIDPQKNRIVVGGKDRLMSKGLIAKKLNLISVETLDRPLDVIVKIRLNHKGVRARVFPFGKKTVQVIFEEPIHSVTPGQSAVFYVGENVLGGGVIETAL